MYRPTKLGVQMATNPAAVHARLKALFAKHKQLGAVAAACGVNRDTVRLWCQKLVAAGYTDPKVPDPQG